MAKMDDSFEETVRYEPISWQLARKDMAKIIDASYAEDSDKNNPPKQNANSKKHGKTL